MHYFYTKLYACALLKLGFITEIVLAMQLVNENDRVSSSSTSSSSSMLLRSNLDSDMKTEQSECAVGMKFRSYVEFESAWNNLF